jgi:MYXO-CTERM domain-containing protein
MHRAFASCLVFAAVVAFGMAAQATPMYGGGSDGTPLGLYPPAGEKAESSFSLNASTQTVAPILPRNAQVQDQSAFAMGTIRWNVVFVQGNGTIQPQQETWTAAEILNVQNKVTAAKNYWEGLTAGFNPACRLSVDINYVNGAAPLLTGYEPSKDTSEVWINSIMSQLGYNSANRYTNVRNFNQAERLAAGKNWATTIFAIDNTSAGLTSYAYAYFGGPFTIVENNAAGWQPQNYNMVLSHEMGHIFMALDEYAASGAKTTDRGGYLNVLNSNASLDGNGNPVTPPQPNALMLNNGNFNTHVPFSPSVPSSQMFGFRDTDADGIPDILDTLPSLTGNNAGSNPLTGLFNFSGSLEVTQLTNQNPLNVGFSNSQSAMTIDTVSSAYYSLDGGLPALFPASDGTYDGYLESLGFSIPGLAFGPHTVDVYGLNNVGNQSNTLRFNFNVTAGSDIPEPCTLALLGLGALGALRSIRRRRAA